MKEIIYITKKDLNTAINEGFKKFLRKRKKPNGLYSFVDETSITLYSNSVWSILQKSYAKIGGYLTYSSIEEMIAKTSLLIVYFIDDVIVACAIYKNTLGGQKLVGCGTNNGSIENKKILREIIQSDIDNYQLWHWAEVSYPLEGWFKEMGGNPIPSDLAMNILHIINKKQKKEFQIIDDVHYSRIIRGQREIKAIYGFKDRETYNLVMKKFEDYAGFKEKINNLPRLDEDYDFNNHTNKTISLAMEIIIQVDNLWEEGYREITPLMKEYLDWALKTLGDFNNKTNQIENLIRNGKYMSNKLTVLSCNDLSDFEAYVTSPAI